MNRQDRMPGARRPAGRDGRRAQRTRESSPAHHQAASPDRFHNPYNFIPALPRSRNGDLGDQRPPTHDRFHSDRWYGRIRVRMTTATPLLLLDTSRDLAGPEERARGHKVFDGLKSPDGTPYIPPSAVKGMLRSAYEAVTNSRFGVFRGHDRPLGYRLSSQDSKYMVPARIECRNGRTEVVLLTGTSRPARDGQPQDRTIYAAWVPLYRAGRNQPLFWCPQHLQRDFQDPVRLRRRHGEEFIALIRRFRHFRNDRHTFDFWRVLALAPVDSVHELPPPERLNRSVVAEGNPSATTRYEATGDFKRVKGFLYVTNRNIRRKHDERLFFVEGEPLRIPLSEQEWQDLRQHWRRLIEDYRDIHDDSEVWEEANGRIIPPEEFLPRDPGRKTDRPAWSPHIYEDGRPRLDTGAEQPDWGELGVGSLCYARVERAGARWQVRGLYPVAISRDLYEAAPASLLHPSLHPAVGLDDLSPADRVFGWVSAGSGRGAYRGNVRIGPVRCCSQEPWEVFEADVPLAILNAPKPAQAAFYTASAPKEERSGEHGSHPVQRRDCGYHEGMQLRGRKVYPHHRHVNAAYWEKPWQDRTQRPERGYYQEYRRPRGRDEREQRDRQNRSIKSWIKPGVEFEFDIYVQHLSDVELGALLWLLRLNEDEELGRDGPFHHRLGGGKPLGFGSVTLHLTGADLRRGSQWAQAYRNFDLQRLAWYMRPPDPQDDSGEALRRTVDAFKQAVTAAAGASRLANARSFATVPFIEAFLIAARGFGDELPIHYPRITRNPDPEGKNYNWFRNAQPLNPLVPTPGQDRQDREEYGGLPYRPPRSRERRR